MADNWVTGFSDAVTPASGDQFLVARSGVNYKLSWAELQAAVGKTYVFQPVAAVTRASATIGAFSTAIDIASVVVLAGQNVELTCQLALTDGGANQDRILCFVRGSTNIASEIFNAAPSLFGTHYTWTDINPGAGTYTYRVQAAIFGGATLTCHQSLVTTDAGGGSSEFRVKVYTP